MNKEELTPAKVRQILVRLADLDQKCWPDQVWRVETEPHDYADGTMHFTHVRTTRVMQGHELTVAIGSNVTPELAELLVLMRNNLPAILHWAHVGLSSVAGAAVSGTPPEENT